MKYFVKILMMALVAIAISSCKKENPDNSNGNHEGIENAYTNAISFNTRNDQVVLFQKELGHPVVVTFNVKDWENGFHLSVTKPDFIEAEIQFNEAKSTGSLSLALNKTGQGKQSVIVSISNTGGRVIAEKELICSEAYLNLLPEAFEFADSPQKANFAFNANFSFTAETAESDADWIFVTVDNEYVWIKVEQNPTEEDRTADILFKNNMDDTFCSVPIHQKGCSDPLPYLSDRELLRRIADKMLKGGMKDEFFEQCLTKMNLKELADWRQKSGFKNYSSFEYSGEYITSFSLHGQEENSDDYVGTLPEEIGYFKKLKFLGIGNMLNLKSPLPESLKKLEKCTWLVIERTGLDGPIPDIFNEMPNLKVLFVLDSQFTGNFPLWLKDKKEDFVFLATGNKLSGQIPDEITHSAWWIPARGFEQHFTDGSAGQRYPYKIWTSDFPNDDPWYFSPVWEYTGVQEEPIIYRWVQFKESEMNDWEGYRYLANK